MTINERVKLIRKDLKIVNTSNSYNISFTDGKNQLVTNGEDITITMNSSIDVIEFEELNELKNALFGISNFSNLDIDVVLKSISMSDFDREQCVFEGNVEKCETVFAYISGVDFAEGIPSPSIDKTTINVILNKNVPKVVGDSFEISFICEYEGSCLIAPLSFVAHTQADYI